jgi:hypothetical protein
MKKLRAFGKFWYDFIIGDDWRIALGVVIGLGLSTVVVHVMHLPAWWSLPAAVIVTLTISLRLAIRRS